MKECLETLVSPVSARRKADPEIGVAGIGTTLVDIVYGFISERREFSAFLILVFSDSACFSTLLESDKKK